MPEASVILLIALLAVAVITVGGILIGQSESQNLEGWLVNSRRMGPIFVWFLLGTEIYTAFTFQGLAGYAFAKGSSAFYNVALNSI